MDVEILIRADSGDVRKTLSADGPISVGRDARCDLCLESQLISRRHITIEVTERSVWVEDLSTNGTYAGELLLHKQRGEIPHNAPIVLGEYTLFVNPAAPRGFAEIAPSPAWGPPFVGAAVPTPLAATPPPLPSRPGPFSADSFASPATLAPPPVPAAGSPKPAGFGPPPHAGATGFDPPTTQAPPGPSPASPAPPRVRGTQPPFAPPPAPAIGPPAAPRARPRDEGAPTAEAKRPPADAARAKSPHADKPSSRGDSADLGPLDRFLADPTVTEIMVVAGGDIYVETGGRLAKTDARFESEAAIRDVVSRILAPLGRRLDDSSRIVEARRSDGTRVHAILEPLALRGSCLTIRKSGQVTLSLDKLVSAAALTQQMAVFLTRCVLARKNILVSGGMSSGRTTMLHALASVIPADERIVTIEDVAELSLEQPHVISLGTELPDADGKGGFTIRELARGSLGMRADRVVVGDTQADDVLDVLRAMTAGRGGAMATTTGNSPAEAISGLELSCLLSGVSLTPRAIRAQILRAVQLVVQTSRFADGSRRVSAVTEVSATANEGQIELRPIFQFERSGQGPGGRILGELRTTGYLPSFADELLALGLLSPGEPVL